MNNFFLSLYSFQKILGVSERSLASISEGRTDIDDIFRELEMSLN